MQWMLMTVIYIYAGLSVAQWGHAMRWLYAPPRILWCGNLVSDPYLFLVNDAGPLAAACAASLIVRSIKARSWSCFTIAALLAFLATSACLAYEGYLLQSEFGMPVLTGIWWLPWT
jgi:hypothetical protein